MKLRSNAVNPVPLCMERVKAQVVFHDGEDQDGTRETQPEPADIDQRMARKFFGDQNPINQVLRVENKWDFKVTGILKDLPINTDRRDEIYLSYTNLKDYNSWLAGESWRGISGGMNCFVLLKPDVAASDVDQIFPGLSKKYYDEMTSAGNRK